MAGREHRRAALLQSKQTICNGATIRWHTTSRCAFSPRTRNGPTNGSARTRTAAIPRAARSWWTRKPRR